MLVFLDFILYFSFFLFYVDRCFFVFLCFRAPMQIPNHIYQRVSSFHQRYLSFFTRSNNFKWVIMCNFDDVCSISFFISCREVRGSHFSTELLLVYKLSINIALNVFKFLFIIYLFIYLFIFLFIYLFICKIFFF